MVGKGRWYRGACVEGGLHERSRCLHQRESYSRGWGNRGLLRRM